MGLPGGGAFNVEDGQFADDTELALCLADGLRGAGPGGPFPADAVAARYRLQESRPFDVGGTCLAAFSTRVQGGGLGEAMVQRAAQQSMRSQANGALMRATPLAVWAHRLPPAGAAAAAGRRGTESPQRRVPGCQRGLHGSSRQPGALPGAG